MRSMRLFWGLSALALVFLSQGAHAQTPAYTITSPGSASFDGSPASIGMEFTTTQTLNLTALGMANVHGPAGFSFSHVVGIYDSTGNLIVSTNLASGNSGHTAGSDNIFRYNDIAYALAPGNYLLAANTDGAEGVYRNDAGLTYSANSAINFNDWTNSGNSDYLYTYYDGSQPADQLFRPTSHFNPTSLAAGPNFLFSTAVPEPTFYQMTVSVALAGLGLLRCRRKK